MKNTIQKFDGERTYTIQHDVEELIPFLNKFKAFVVENSEYLESLGIDGYISDAIGDAQFVLNKFMEE